MFLQDTQTKSANDRIWPAKTKTSPKTGPQTDGAINIPALLGPRSWSRLPQAVRDRLANPVRAGESITYHGTMHKATATGFGKLMAIIARLAGAPVAHLTGPDVPCEVKLYHDKKRGGTVWERVYHFDSKTVRAATTKKAANDGSSLECFGNALGLGSGMVLDIFEAGTALHFVSRHFFIEIFGLRLKLPQVLNPGQPVVTHRDLGHGTFQFLMTVTHLLLGEIMFQDGTFHDPENAAC